MDSSKGALIEKIMFALMPVLFSCIVYLVSSLSEANTRITSLESRLQNMVTPETVNRLEMAREKLRQDVLNVQTENIERHAENIGAIKVLEWRVSALEGKK